MTPSALIDVSHDIVAKAARQTFSQQADIDDAKQEAYLRLLEVAKQVDGLNMHRVRGYAWKTAKSAVIQLGRKRTQKFYAHPHGVEFPILCNDTQCDVDFSDEIDVARRSLNERDSAVLTMFLLGHTRKEVSEGLGLSLSTVYRICHNVLGPIAERIAA